MTADLYYAKAMKYAKAAQSLAIKGLVSNVMRDLGRIQTRLKRAARQSNIPRNEVYAISKDIRKQMGILQRLPKGSSREVYYIFAALKQANKGVLASLAKNPRYEESPSELLLYAAKEIERAIYDLNAIRR